MLFGRRNPASWKETLRVWLWPRRSWVRSTKYFAKRVLRLTASTHAVSAGIAAGVFASFTPFLGLHVIIACAVAYVIAGNFLAAAIGTFFGNPLTFPFIWATTYNVGSFVLHGETRDANSGLHSLSETDFWTVGLSGIWEVVIGIWEPVIKPMAIGAVPCGVVVGIVSYLVTRGAVILYRNTKRAKRASKAAEKA